ncbi:hypothetical protein D9757_001193 [Collybiopsis confluens]|uniref:Uncharacterized protein n=1 Tax=Collybiopsis confluens TaxID=2823264 RepID=A0A8H5I119_9AGAR|nr:hypothetical protein D9757_001193 [Collybiopsis confluens]
MYIFRKIVAFGPGFDQKVVTEVNAALNQWMSALPDHLRWDASRPDGLFHRQSAVLHCLYYWTQMQLHKQFIPRPNESALLMFPSLAICANAARCCVKIFEAMEGTEVLIVPHMTAPVYVTATILLLNIWRNKRLTVQADVTKDLQDARRCMRVSAVGKTKVSQGSTNNRVSQRDALSSIVAMVDLYLDGRGASESVGQSLGLNTPTERSSAGSSSGSRSMSPDETKLRLQPVNTRGASSLPFALNIPSVRPESVRAFFLVRLNKADNFSAGGPRMEVQSTSPMFSQNLNVTPPSISAAIPEEEWSSFMANVDVLLQSVDQRSYAARY